jgi:hypothetical protein
MLRTKIIMKVQIRYNTNYPKSSDKKWRVLVEGTQHLVDHIEIKTNSWTSEDEVLDGEGNKIKKFHISSNCTTVKFEELQGEILALVM